MLHFVVSILLVFPTEIPFSDQDALFNLTQTPFVILLSFVCFDHIYRCLAQFPVSVFTVFLSWGTQVFVQVDTASLSIVPALPVPNFPPSTKREHTDGTGNLAASYSCPLEFLSNTDQ